MKKSVQEVKCRLDESSFDNRVRIHMIPTHYIYIRDILKFESIPLTVNYGAICHGKL